METKFTPLSARSLTLRILGLIVCLLLIASCAGGNVEGRPVNDLYCDNFLVYRMCARDSNRDGIVDFTYFEESKEIFMFRNRLPRRIPAGLGVHRCARAMDEDLVATTSRVFYVDESTSLLERTDIRGAMMLKYIATLPEVTACNMRAEEALADDGEE